MNKHKAVQHSDFTLQKSGQNAPGAQKNTVSSSVSVKKAAAAHLYSGPIPSSDEMERYNRINPDLVKQIVQMAQDEQKNRFETERINLSLAEKESKRADEIVRINSRNTLIGQITAFIIVVLFFMLLG